MKYMISRSIGIHINSVGYGLFLAANAAGIWCGLFPFLPISFQTPEIMLIFFLSQSLSFSGCYLASTVGAYYLSTSLRKMLTHIPVALPALPYFIGWITLIGALYLHAYSSALVMVGGALLGLGSAGFFILWQRLFASYDIHESQEMLTVGVLLGSCFYFALSVIPRAITSYLIPLVCLPLFVLPLVLSTREIDMSQSMFLDTPRKHREIYKKALSDYLPSTLCMGALGLCSGVVRALAIETIDIGIIVNITSMIAAGIGAAVLLSVYKEKYRRVNLMSVYRLLFPLLITGFVLFPFVPMVCRRIFSASLYAVYAIATIVVMMQCAQASRNSGLNPVFIYGFVGGVVYLCHDIGFLAGTLGDALSISAMSSSTLIALFALYLLGIMYSISFGEFKRSLRCGSHGFPCVRMSDPNHLELTAAIGAQGKNMTSYDTKQKLRGAVNSDEHKHLRDRISKQCVIAQQLFRLTDRETEITELSVRGYTVARVAEELVVSENTVRTHMKKIYVKTGVHKKQDLIVLVEGLAEELTNEAAESAVNLQKRL